MSGIHSRAVADTSPDTYQGDSSGYSSGRGDSRSSLQGVQAKYPGAYTPSSGGIAVQQDLRSKASGHLLRLTNGHRPSGPFFESESNISANLQTQAAASRISHAFDATSKQRNMLACISVNDYSCFSDTPRSDLEWLKSSVDDISRRSGVENLPSSSDGGLPTMGDIKLLSDYVDKLSAASV
ncbi:uncharacterized protein I303_108269 [Kwoniella dejecticola CBS 10117]|uniref:Uncharacterized protein n=1 Tax=Kwoniella dejecticola CBS 10117 TaxID=1296121 RepID=A0A1A5ZXV6_9TREE|nr:uncharacterized protein I303_07404 [Kwoniella dejecticola CBS 10117]OBR82642.1 hypothetical protein I303_07404 [Kwoniella dejecticola CBS 10117]